jgi:hypothetical protein
MGENSPNLVTLHHSKGRKKANMYLVPFENSEHFGFRRLDLPSEYFTSGAHVSNITQCNT